MSTQPSPMVTMSDAAPAPATPNPAVVPNEGGGNVGAPAQSSDPSLSAPPKNASGVHGVLGGILMGALAGAAKAVTKTAQGVGRTLGNFADNSPRGQELKQNSLVRQKETQDLGIDKQKAQQAQTAAMDEHTTKMIANNTAMMDAIHKVHENAHLDAMYPGAEELQRQTVIAGKRAEDTADKDTLSTLEAAGVHLDTSHGAGHDGLTADHAQKIANGELRGFSNGETGDKAGYAFVDNAELENTPLPSDTKVLTDWKFDSKTNTFSPQYSTLKAGQNTAMDVVLAHDAAAKKMQQLQDQYAASQKMQKGTADINEQKAKTTEEQGSAAEHFAKAKLAQGGVTDENKALTGQSFINTLPPAMQDGVQGLLRYQIKPSDLGRGQEKLPIMEAAIHADPAWSQAKYNERYNYLSEYGTSKSGDGATRNRLNTAVGHLDMLAQASQALDQQDLPTLQKIANTLGVAAGGSAPIIYDAIANKAAAEAAGAMKGGGAAPTDPEIETAAKSFNKDNASKARMDNIRAQYGLLATQVGTINGKFQSTMGQSPEEFGQPVLYGGNQDIMKKWLGGGGNAGVFNSQKWAAANPGKDVNAAVEAAKAKGMQVK